MAGSQFSEMLLPVLVSVLMFDFQTQPRGEKWG